METLSPQALAIVAAECASEVIAGCSAALLNPPNGLTQKAVQDYHTGFMVSIHAFLSGKADRALAVVAAKSASQVVASCSSTLFADQGEGQKGVQDYHSGIMESTYEFLDSKKM